MLRISEHFTFEEFSNRGHTHITPIQLGMVENLCKSVLEPLRKFLGKSPISISSGLRYPSDINALRAKGYFPSETSDHLFGNVIKLREAKKVQRFGRYYGYSVGAVDIVPSIGAKEAFNAIQPFIDKENNSIRLPNGIGTVRVGQLIFEQWGEKAWMHISNPVDLIYSFKVTQEITKYRMCFLQTVNGGRTYTSI